MIIRGEPICDPANSVPLSIFKGTTVIIFGPILIIANILVKRDDVKNSNYYLAPFNKPVKRGGLLTSAVIILDANSGYFKEASWTKKPEKFLKVDEKEAVKFIVNYINKDFSDKLQKLPKIPLKQYLKQRDNLYKDYAKLISYVNDAKKELHWKPNSGYSSSPYQPYWRIDANGYIWYVTQEGKVVCETGFNKAIAEIEANRVILEDVR